MNGLDVSHLRKQYGDFVAVSDLSLHVDRGEILGLIGPNGAGKSTSMLMMTGLLKADAGTVVFDGEAYDPHSSKMRSRFGIVPQDLAVYPELTALQNLQFFGKLNGVYGSKLRERIDFVLRITGLTEHANSIVQTFSGGMARRLNFGIALVHEPEFVMLDEPTVGIDPQSRTNLLDGVRELCNQGTGVLYASHYMEEVEALCDRVAIMDHGKLLASGTLDELLNRNDIDIAVEVESLPAEIFDRLKPIAEIESSDESRKQRILIRKSSNSSQDQSKETRQLRQILEILESSSIPILKIVSEDVTLESVFLKLTGRRLRD